MACPNAAGGTGSGTGNPSSNSGGASEGGTGGGFVLNELQQILYDCQLVQDLASTLKNQSLTEEVIVIAVNELNGDFKSIGFIVEDKNPENGLAQGTSEAQIKERFIPKEDTSALSPYAPIKSAPAGLFLIIPKFYTDTKKGSIILAGKEAEKSFVRTGNITIINGKTQAAITKISYGSWGRTHDITDNKITIDGKSYDISALLNSIP